MIVAHVVDATVAVALDDRAIGTERARLSRFAHAPATEDHLAVRIFAFSHK
jgi:cytochrome b